MDNSNCWTTCNTFASIECWAASMTLMTHHFPIECNSDWSKAEIPSNNPRIHSECCGGWRYGDVIDSPFRIHFAIGLKPAPLHFPGIERHVNFVIASLPLVRNQLHLSNWWTSSRDNSIKSITANELGWIGRWMSLKCFLESEPRKRVSMAGSDWSVAGHVTSESQPHPEINRENSREKISFSNHELLQVARINVLNKVLVSKNAFLLHFPILVWDWPSADHVTLTSAVIFHPLRILQNIKWGKNFFKRKKPLTSHILFKNYISK